MRILKVIDEGNIAYAVFHHGEVVGFIFLGNVYFGSRNQYLELKMFQVSEPFRKLGIGKRYFLD